MLACAVGRNFIGYRMNHLRLVGASGRPVRTSGDHLGSIRVSIYQSLATKRSQLRRIYRKALGRRRGHEPRTAGFQASQAVEDIVANLWREYVAPQPPRQKGSSSPRRKSLWRRVATIFSMLSFSSALRLRMKRLRRETHRARREQR